jgi:hypothetical protein
VWSLVRAEPGQSWGGVSVETGTSPGSGAGSGGFIVTGSSPGGVGENKKITGEAFASP